MLDLVINKKDDFDRFCNKDCKNCKLVEHGFVTGKNESCLPTYALIDYLVTYMDENDNLRKQNEKLLAVNFEQFCLLQGGDEE